MWRGDCAVEPLPSPKSQLHATIVPSASVLPSVKSHVRSEHDDVNAAAGGAFDGGGRVTSFEVVPLAPSSSSTVRLTVYVPGKS